MGVVKDRVLFECMEKAGPRLIETMFGNTNPEDKEFQTLCVLIISRALDRYVKSEYGNLWESYQCRPHGKHERHCVKLVVEDMDTSGHQVLSFLLVYCMDLPFL